MERYYWAALQMTSGLGSSKIKSLVSYFGSAQAAWKANRRDLFFSGCLNDSICNNLITRREKIDIHKIAAEWSQKRINVCTLNDDDYPQNLKTIFDPPAVFYYRGELADKDTMVAIVGARRATAYGKNAAGWIAAELAGAGVGVVSGAARGIDTSAHLGALKSGYTIAVLGCGVDVVYPRENTRLLADIAERGLIISEYSPGTPPIPGYFPARNRIISGLSKGVIVVEAAEKSGALITADFALEEGRDVFAVPGSIFSAASKGVHRLIKQGAKLIENADDILEEYGLQRQNAAKLNTISLTPEETTVYKALAEDCPLLPDEILPKVSLPANSVSYLLIQLELKGLVMQTNGQRYVRVPGRESV
jgi:DNA processing protein